MDCKTPNTYIWPSSNGRSCTNNKDCSSVCCSNKICTEQSNCYSAGYIVSGIVVSIVGILFLILCCKIYRKNFFDKYQRKKKKGSQKIEEKEITKQIDEDLEDEEDFFGYNTKANSDFNPNFYVIRKLIENNQIPNEMPILTPPLNKETVEKPEFPLFTQ